MRKLRTGAMPPAGRPRPDAATYDAVASHLEAKLDAAAKTSPDPGRLPLFHRLTRTEYKNAIRDLLGLDDLSKDVDLDLLLPADNSSSGFDNIADLLFVSSTQLEQYLSAAQKLSAVAIGDQSLPPLVDVYRMSEQFNQEYQADGAPFGTRGGTVIRTYLPLDGDYRIHIELADAPREPHQLEVVVDDERVGVISAELPNRPAAAEAETATKDAAPADVETVAEKLDEIATEIKINSVVNRRFELDRRNEARRKSAREGFRSRPAHEGGPARDSRDVPQAHVRERRSAHSTAAARQGAAAGYCERHASWSAENCRERAIRRAAARIFICARHAAESGLRKEDSLVAGAPGVSPAGQRSRSAAPARRCYEAERGESGFEAGIKQGLERILVSPQFLFRIERQPAKVAAGSRLSDQRSRAGVASVIFPVEQHSRRRAARARRARASSAIERCSISRCAGCFAIPVPRRSRPISPRNGCICATCTRRRRARDCFPISISSLREAFERETTLFLESVFREDRSVLDLLRSNDTFMNERLAKHYGVPNVLGNDFRRVTYPDDNPRRGLGLLGHSSILTLTSYANRTSPVLRGKYVLGNLLGAPPAPPPPNIPALATENKESGKVLPMREAHGAAPREPRMRELPCGDGSDRVCHG